MRKTADLLGSISREKLNRFLNDYYQFLQAYIFKPLKEQLLIDKEQGYHTVLLSGNLDIILQPFKEEGFDTIIGSQSTLDGQLLGSDDIHILIEGDKKARLLEVFPHADYDQSKAYADNGYDLPILQLVGHAYAVNPDKELETYAKTYGFEVIKKEATMK
jgi:phosphoserine phosphatase